VRLKRKTVGNGTLDDNAKKENETDEAKQSNRFLQFQKDKKNFFLLRSSRWVLPTNCGAVGR
jgi:hypothetical protein